MSQIAVNEATSNIQTWLNLIGLHPAWAQLSNIDIIITVIAIIVFIIMLILIFWPKEKNKDNCSINITSHNQSGGIIAQNVHNLNMGNVQRTLNETTKEALLNEIKENDSFRIIVKMDDDEANTFCFAIKDFLKKHGRRYNGIQANSMSGGNGDIVLQKEKNNDFTLIIVGSNIKTKTPIKFGGMSIGIENGD